MAVSFMMAVPFMMAGALRVGDRLVEWKCKLVSKDVDVSAHSAIENG